MRILGVDPGSMATGWGLIEGPPGRPRLLECGVIRLRGSDFACRLASLRDQFDKLVERLQPDCAAVESPFHGVNARSALQLAHARGVVLAALGATGVEVGEYTPATVKKSVTGNGRAAKPQVREMVFRLLSTPAGDAAADLSDALAVALCHQARRLVSARLSGRGAQPSRSGSGRRRERTGRAAR